MESVLKFWGAMWLVVGVLSFLNVLSTAGGGFGAFMTSITILACTVAPFVLLNVGAGIWENVSEKIRKQKLANKK